MILIIALLHAIPIILVAALFNSRKAVWLAATVMSVVAMVTGASAYTAMDLIGVGLGTWVCLSNMPVKQHG
jgi:hypothetical protein